LPLSGKIFFITAESAEIAEKKRYNKKQKISLQIKGTGKKMACGCP
jgi:hypothetical protein